MYMQVMITWQLLSYNFVLNVEGKYFIMDTGKNRTILVEAEFF